jgi:hypothetical protein
MIKHENEKKLMAMPFCTQNQEQYANRRSIRYGGRIYLHIRDSVLRNEARPGTKTRANQGQAQQMQMQMQIQQKKVIKNRVQYKGNTKHAWKTNCVQHVATHCFCVVALGCRTNICALLCAPRILRIYCDIF